jgi:hypothetical protein
VSGASNVDNDQKLDLLLGPRRRGIRRGRRIHQRAAIALIRFNARCQLVADILTNRRWGWEWGWGDGLGGRVTRRPGHPGAGTSSMRRTATCSTGLL